MMEWSLNLSSSRKQPSNEIFSSIIHTCNVFFTEAWRSMRVCKILGEGLKQWRHRHFFIVIDTPSCLFIGLLHNTWIYFEKATFCYIFCTVLFNLQFFYQIERMCQKSVLFIYTYYKYFIFCTDMPTNIFVASLNNIKRFKQNSRARRMVILTQIY